jgi:amidase
VAARAALRLAAAAARAAGHQVLAGDPPYPRTLANAWMECWFAGIAEEVERLGLDVRQLEPRTQGMVARGRRLRQRGRPTGVAGRAWRDRALAWFDRYDVMLSPTVAGPAPKMGWATTKSFIAAYLNGARATPFTQAWNLAGFPAMSLPIGAMRGGLPGSVQLVAAPGREASLLALASQLEASTVDAR